MWYVYIWFVIWSCDVFVRVVYVMYLCVWFMRCIFYQQFQIFVSMKYLKYSYCRYSFIVYTVVEGCDKCTNGGVTPVKLI